MKVSEDIQEIFIIAGKLNKVHIVSRLEDLPMSTATAILDNCSALELLIVSYFHYSIGDGGIGAEVKIT